MGSSNHGYGLREPLAPGDLDAEKKRDETRWGIPVVFVMEDNRTGIERTSERDRNRRSLDR
jgi:hypothetical protein